MDTKHTPGEWHIEKSGTGKYNRVFTIYGTDNLCEKCGKGDGQWLICETLESAVGYKKAEANAKLIAAAPELLEALQGILDIGKRDTSNPKYDCYYNTAKEAIKKATE